MDGARFDRLAASWARRHSRRGALSQLAALAFGSGLGQRHKAVVAQEVGAARISCRGRCDDGQVCKHGACFDRCDAPGTCSGGGQQGPPTCGPAEASCSCVAVRSGAGYCLAASRSTPEGNGCISRGCRGSRDCAKGQVCAQVPGCCPNKPRICAVPCPASAPEVRQVGGVWVLSDSANKAPTGASGDAPRPNVGHLPQIDL